MPIYAYRCSACGHTQDVLQKLSDPRLTTCPECGRDTYQKQVTAAGFRLKGTGWYATDFRGGSSGHAGSAPDHHGGSAVDSAAPAKPAGGTESGKAPAASPSAPG